MSLRVVHRSVYLPRYITSRLNHRSSPNNIRSTWTQLFFCLSQISLTHSNSKCFLSSRSTFFYLFLSQLSTTMTDRLTLWSISFFFFSFFLSLPAPIHFHLILLIFFTIETRSLSYPLSIFMITSNHCPVARCQPSFTVGWKRTTPIYSEAARPLQWLHKPFPVH